MNDTTAFALGFFAPPFLNSNTEDETQAETKANTQHWLSSEHTQTDAYPSSLHGLTADAAVPYQLSIADTGFQYQHQLGGARVAAVPIRPPPLNLQHSHTQRLHAFATGPVTPSTPYLPLSNLTLHTAALPTVNSSPLSQPQSGYSTFSSVVSPGSVASTTLSSPSSYSTTSADAATFETAALYPSLSTSLSPQLFVPTADLTVTDLGLAPEDKSLPDDMMDICKVEPDADLDDPCAGPAVVNTVPSAPFPHFNSPSSLSANISTLPAMPSTPTSPSKKSLHSSPMQYLSHGRDEERPLPPMSLHPPPNPKPKGFQKFKYVFKAPRAASPDDLRHLEIPPHIRDAYGSRRRLLSSTNMANGASNVTLPRRAWTSDDRTPPASPPAPYLRRRPAASEDEEDEEDELQSDSQAAVTASSQSPERGHQSLSPEPELRSVSSSDYSPDRGKRKAPTFDDDGQRQRPRSGDKRMKQNRNAQKKYRDKNRRLAELRADFNVTALVLVEKVRGGEASAKTAFSQLAGHSRVFKDQMRRTCPTTYERLMSSVDEALRDQR